MKVAIIENDRATKEKLKNTIKQFNWDINFFINSAEFSHRHLNDYDIIIFDNKLKGINGQDLIKSISSKTDAELILLGDSFNDEDINNQKIKALVNKNDINNMIKHLNYINIKLRIKNLIAKESEKLKNIRHDYARRV